MTSVTEKIREHFRKNPAADVKKAAAKFNQPVSRIYKLRKEVKEENLRDEQMDALDTPKRKVTINASQLAIAKKLGIKPADFVSEGIRTGVLQYDDERESEGETVDVDETLDERAKDYGKFKDGAALMQGIKRLLADHAAKHDKTFTDDQWEALEMIVHKVGRIVNGNPDKVDHWTDIAGYAKLVADRLEGVER